jgi:hypothetical protein
MVADPRHKVVMRLRATLAELAVKAQGGPTEQHRVAMAQTDYNVAVTVRAEYRSAIIREFPGCTVTFARQHIAILLPKEYPQSNVPVTTPLAPVMIECLSPRGLSNQPF